MKNSRHLADFAKEALRGVDTPSEIDRLMSSVIQEMLLDKVSPARANKITRMAGKRLKEIERRGY